MDADPAQAVKAVRFGAELIVGLIGTQAVIATPHEFEGRVNIPGAGYRVVVIATVEPVDTPR